MKTNPYAGSLRKNTSPIEQRLWFFLRDRRLGGYKFRRQQSMGPYVVDFYCAEKNLAIELDGPSHGEAAQRMKDPHRQRFLETQGLTVLRYLNEQIIHELEIVLEDILKKLNS